MPRVKQSAFKEYTKKEISPKSPEKKKKKYRFKSGTVALREIKKYQKSTDAIIPRAPFKRLVKNIILSYGPEFKMSFPALDAI